MQKTPPSLRPLFFTACLTAAVSGLSCVERPINGGEGEKDRPLFIGNPPAYINEVYSANADYKDEFGGDPGWAEFYNPADTAVNLLGYWLTNSVNSVNQRRWEFGDVVIEPRGYLAVFLSGRGDRPDSAPARDSIDLIGRARGAWNWADDRSTDPGGPGRSTATHTFVRNASIGGKLTAVDNPALGWSSAVVMLSFADVDGDYNVVGGSAVNMSGIHQILLRGYVTKGAKLEIRLPSDGVRDWEAWPAVLTGTGEADGLYAVELPSSGYPDLSCIYGIRFANPPSFRGTAEFSFTSIAARTRGSEAHASFELNRGGGKLFLMDSGWNIRDSVAYPAEALGLSYAKRLDRVESADKGAWALSKPPTPNAANSNEYYDGQVPPPPASAIPKSGYHADSLMFTLPEAGGGDGVVLRCDTSGAFPSPEGALRPGVTLNLKKTAVMRCAQFKEGSYPSAAIMRTYIIDKRKPDLPVVSIAADPVEMFDPAVGIYATGPNASPQEPHYGANYWADIELPIHIDFFEGGARHAWSYAAGLEIFGNYSRMHAKKSVAINFREEYGQKNLGYALLPEHPRLTKFKRFVLRNNGNNYGRDYIRDMLMSSLTEGLGIDYQKGRAAIVFYNGRYYGIHNLRERANARYFEANYGIDAEFIDLVKANNEVNSGSDADYQRILKWAEAKSALSDGDVRQLEEWIDLGNFTNIFQSEIYFMDTDWPGNNMKRWRTNAPPSKWKWFMYDNDFGFGGNSYLGGRSVNMLEFLTGPPNDWPNPPHATLLFRKLIANAGYRNAFVNRFSLLLATYFSPAKVEARIDALMAPIESEIPYDQARWGHSASWMNSELNAIRNFGRSRAVAMQGEMEAFFKISGAADLTVSSGGSGSVLIHNLPMPIGSVTFKAYPAVPVELKAVPGPGARFERWSDGVTEAERAVAVVAGQAAEYQAVFGAAAF
ncbi:MAG: CotH kinase family protein [Chitinispirillales bacterium]|nr:CotH kinase family protein [Chitinispirillales bacterium]